MCDCVALRSGMSSCCVAQIALPCIHGLSNRRRLAAHTLNCL
jgi:hypothetical protein